MKESGGFWKFVLGFLLGALLMAALATSVFYLNEGLWFATIKKDQDEIKVHLERIEIEKLEAINKLIDIYVRELEKQALLFGPENSKRKEVK